MTQQDEADEVTRRSLVRGVAVGGLALPLLAACGGNGSSNGSAPARGGSGGSGGSGGASPGGIVATADVPVGGGTVVPDQQVVVTQPTKGDFKAFTAICTHQGCTVGKVDGGTHHLPLPRQPVLDRGRLGHRRARALGAGRRRDHGQRGRGRQGLTPRLTPRPAGPVGAAP